MARHGASARKLVASAPPRLLQVRRDGGCTARCRPARSDHRQPRWSSVRRAKVSSSDKRPRSPSPGRHDSEHAHAIRSNRPGRAAGWRGGGPGPNGADRSRRARIIRRFFPVSDPHLLDRYPSDPCREDGMAALPFSWKRWSCRPARRPGRRGQSSCALPFGPRMVWRQLADNRLRRPAHVAGIS